MGLKIDGIAASSAIDTSSEAIDIENLDISSLKAGQGVLNYEHRNPKQPGASFLDILGAITYARKIMNEDDCENDRQRKYWEQVQLPFVYIQAELFDDEKHPGAVAAAAIIRFYHDRGMPILVRFSIDGHTIERDGNVLKHCIARDVALTIKPANHSCVSGVIDGKAKTSGGLDELSRSEDGLHRYPGVEFQMLGPETQADPVALIRHEVNNLQDMVKAMTVSGAGVTAPGDARGGAALVKEDVQPLKQRLTTAYRDWNRRSGKTLEEHLVKAIPDVHPDFLKKFVDLITENQLRKASELHDYLNKALEGADGEATKVVGKPKNPKPEPSMSGPKPVMNDDEPDNQKITPEQQAEFDKQFHQIRAQIHANNPNAMSGTLEPGAFDKVPHVPGLRVGVHPDHAVAKDIESINAQIRMTNPNVDQHGMVAPGTPEWHRNQAIMAGRGAGGMQPDVGLQMRAPGGTAVLPREPTAATKVLPTDSTGSVVRKDEAPIEVDDGHKPLSIRGVAVQPNKGHRIPTFDENAGVLHTERGSFPMYIPSRDSPKNKKAFHDVMKDPKVNEFHDYAVRNWVRLHQHLKDGKLPPAVIMHATLFSQLSPNTPVPMQELMYGHLVDHMAETGVDARNPGFGAEHNRDAWKARGTPQGLPKVSPDHWPRIESQIRNKGDSKFNERKAGDIGAFMLADNKWKNMAQYSTIHNRLSGIINSNRDDARKSVRELMLEKTRGAGIPGLAPKTSRYMMGMLGGGNVMVPDTHFIRYLFGLDKKHDSKTIGYLKNVMWRDTVPGADTLDSIDRYYFRHHDAVKHMLEHPEHGKYFKDNPEAAIFPAFWKNWVGIVPHERARGLTTGGSNEFTDHRPFWEAVAPFLKSEDQDLWELAHRTATQHHEWVKQHGEAQAMMLYAAHLLPHLMTVGSLKKAEPSAWTEAQMPRGQAVKFKGLAVEPGELRYRDDLQHPLAGQSFKLLSSDDVHHTVVSGSGPSGKVMRIPRHLEGKAYEVIRPATPTTIPQPLATENLHHHSRSPEQLALAQRIDFAHPKRPIHSEGTHANRGETPWVQGDPHKVFIKPSANYLGDDYVMRPDAAVREAAFHNVARDAFGLGHLVPTTVAFWHPQDGRLHSAQDFVHGGNHVDKESQKTWHAQGLSPKMAIMDYVLGNSDRWEANVMRAPDGSPRLIDNGFAFQYSGSHDHPAYVGNPHETFHPEVGQWVNGIMPEKLTESMLKSGLPHEAVEQAVGRLNKIKQMVAQGRPLSYHSVVKK